MSKCTTDQQSKVDGREIHPATDDGVNLRDIVLALGGDPAKVEEGEAVVPVALRRLSQHGVLLHEGAPATTVYVLRSGTLKHVRVWEDGYEQVLSVAQSGELVGYEALHCGHQPTGVVALEDVTAYAVPVSALQALRRQCPALDQAVQAALSRQLVRAAGVTEMMAPVSADVRLARFLLWNSRCRAELGQSPTRFVLRMGRRDVASLLGVAHETVSRSFTLLAELGYVRVLNREVEILDVDALRMRARSTRRPSEDALRRVRRAATAPRTAVLPAAWFPRPVTGRVHVPEC